jgi:predicted RNA binding protein YcfA (HicA-like mRNA interferase family)
MGKKLPHLRPREVEANIKGLGFVYKRTNGSHETWERLADAIIPQRKIVQVDVAISQFDDRLMKSMIRQSGFTADEFCTGVMNPSRKITVQPTAPKVATVAAPATKKSN